MPLLHKAPYQFRSVPQDLKDDDEVFHIRATKEVFKTYEEYIAKAQLYTKEVWSCSLTGKSNLTLEEALEAEECARKKLEKFPVVLEKPTLLLAHHSQKNLDWMASTLTNQFKAHCATGEIVTVLIGEERKTGKILECITSLDAEEGDEDMYRYKIILLGTGEQLSHIPHKKLERKLQMPSKELIKMFIREHTNKQSNMFNVKKEMLLKYNIPHKFATITSVLRTPSNVKDKGNKKGGPKMINSKPSTASKNKSTPKTSTTPKSASKPTSTPKMIKIHSVGEDGRLITTWKEVPQKTPSKSSPVKSSPKKSSPVTIIEEITILSDSDSPNNNSEKKSKTPASTEKPKKPPLTEEQKRERKKKRAENLELREFTNKVKTLVEKYKDQITPMGGNSATPTKGGMKQTSLLSYTHKHSISSTIREIIEAEDNGYRRSLIVNDLAKSMTSSVSQNLPLATPVKCLLMEKREKLLEREKLAKMTLEQREKYIREKEELRIAALQKKREEKMAEQQRLKEERMRQREIEREAARQARLAQQALERIIIDDLSLDDSKQLPPYIPVDLPEGISPAAFPKLALVADAIHFFRHIFTQPEDDLNYNSDLLIQASLEGPRGHKVLSNLLISMLQTLGQELRDKVKIPQLEVPLSTVDLSEFNVGASVLVYITYLLQQEEYEDSELDNIAQILQKSEFYDLTPSHKIHVLFVMCNEIFKTGTFNAAIQESIDQTTQLRKRIQAEAILRNKQRQDEKLKMMQNTLKKGLGGVVQKGEKSEAKILSEEEEEEEDDNKDEDGDEGIGSEDDDEDQSASDLATAVKRRQEEMKKKKEEEREERAKQEQERIKERKFREQQAKIENQRKKEEQLKSDLENKVQSIRNEPLGMDRNYARYWLFSGTSGLYIEQGWWSVKHFSSIEKKSDSLNTSNTSETSEDSGVLTRPEPVTVPPTTSPCWYVVPTLAAFDELKNSLNKRGVREKALLAALNKEDERCRAAIRKMNYPSRQHRLIGNQELTIKGLKKDVTTMDHSLGYAGLGGLDNISKLMKPDLPTVEQISTAMLSLQETVDAKYLKKPMCSIYNPSDLTFTYHGRVQKWRHMVEAASTYSDLHMLLSVLDNCIKWERSLDNIKCRSCKKKGDERKLLICDICDTGYHCGCLRPPLKKVPDGDWLCPDCEPVVEKNEEESSDSGECSEEEQDDEENDDYCCVCEKGGELILCDKCPSAYHLVCHDPPLKRIPRGDWACYKCQKDGSSEEDEEEEESDEEVSNCSVCNKGGKLLVCSECEETYHMKCHDPPIKHIPSKSWKCSLCRPTFDSKPKKRSSSNSSRGKPGKKRKVEKKKARSRVQEIKSEEDEEEETTETEEDERRSSSHSGKGRPGKKRKMGKRGRPRIQEIKSEDEEETTETEEDDVDEEEEEEEEEEQESRRSSRSKSNKKTTSRKSGRESRSRKSDKGAAESREERSNRRSLKRGIDDKLEICEEIVSDLLKIPESADFIDLVDKKKVPDYYDLIERPICLSQIKEKTLYLQYESCEEFLDDMLTLFENCFSYNLEQSEVYDNGRTLRVAFLSMLKSRLPHLHKTVEKSRKSE